MESETADSASARSTPKATAPKTARKSTPATKPARKETSATRATPKTTPAKVNKKAVKAKPAPAKTTPSKAKTALSKASSTKAAFSKKPAEPPDGRAPIQGYEPEEEVELGKTVNPPSGVELVESVADIFGELANSSLAAGGRILKDAFSLLRRP